MRRWIVAAVLAVGPLHAAGLGAWARDISDSDSAPAPVVEALARIAPSLTYDPRPYGFRSLIGNLNCPGC